MVVIVVLGALLLLGIAILAVAWPLVQERRSQGQAELALDALPEVDPLVDLYAQRDSIYQAIRELRFDHQVGKVSDADYRAFDSHLRANAAAVLKQIDALKRAEADPALDASLEAEIAALRQVNGSGPIQTEPLPALAPVGKASLNFCPQCGQRLQPGSRFCGTCGAALT